jgi:ABC-type sugar transport system ATPase subunit
MKDGKILQYDTPELIYTKPVSTFVGWFLGNPGMNYIKCTARPRQGRNCLDAGAFIASEKIPTAYEARVSADRKVILGIRPEHVAVSRTQTNGYIRARCLFSEPVGSRLLLNVELAPDVQINVKAPTEVKVAKGDELYVQFPEKHMILFDDKNEQAI